MKAILAGMLIVVGAVTYLTIGGIAGAVLFSIGLITILVFKLDLFTGKAGLLFQQKIGLGDLVEIWILNLIGTGIAAWGIYMTPLSAALYPKAQAIMQLRVENGTFANFILGMFCGLLMYVAVEGYGRTHNLICVIFPVTVFILCGFNHSIADMSYYWLSNDPTGFWTLIPTTVGNLIGSNVCCLLHREGQPV